MDDKVVELLQTILATLDLSEDSTTSAQRQEVFTLLREANTSAYSRGYSNGVASVTKPSEKQSDRSIYTKDYTKFDWQTFGDYKVRRSDNE